MSSTKTITVELPPFLLDNLETYVRSLEGYLALPAGVPSAELEAADDAVRSTSIVVLAQLVNQLKGLETGSLGEVIDEHHRNIQARLNL